MKKRLIISVVLTVACNCFALHLAEPNQVLVTVEPNAYPTVWENGFDVKGQTTAWIDNRTYETNMQVYWAYLNDPCKTEYLIDANAAGVEFIKIDGNDVFYSRIDPNTGDIIIRKADCTNPNNPIIKDINTPGNSSGSFRDYIISLDVSGNRLVYAIREYYGNAQIYAINLNDPCCQSRLVSDCNSYSGYLQANVALDGTTCVWNGNAYDPCSEQYYNFLAVADIADINNPLIRKTVMPQSNGNELSLGSLDISGDWLVANCYYSSGNAIFGIHNFQNADVNQWDVAELWPSMSGEFSLGSPVIDGSYAVWTLKIYGVSSLIAGATLLDNGSASTILLKETQDPNADFSAARISGSEIVWSYYYYDYSIELDYADLYSGTLVSDCGDWGYLFADFNNDCKVDFKDFAKFAEQWLECTSPGGENCIYGDIYPSFSPPTAGQKPL